MSILDEALSEAGTAEIRGPKHNPKIIEWFRVAGAGWIEDDESAWCSAFACAMAERAGLCHPKSVRARRWLDLGPDQADEIEAGAAKPGDIVVFSRGHSRTAGHVGVLICRVNGTMWVIGGNQRNAVQPRPYPAAKLLGVRRLKPSRPSHTK